jgi:hypothetical protein
MGKILLYGLGGVGAWWLADHLSIDQGGTGFSFPYRTDADKQKLAQTNQKNMLTQGIPAAPTG